MELRGRPVEYYVKRGYPYAQGTFLFYGQGIEYADGKNPIPLSKVFIERTDGQIVVLDPEKIRFTDKKPEPLAEDSGDSTTHNR